MFHDHEDESRGSGMVGPLIVMVVMCGLVYVALNDPSRLRIPDGFWTKATAIVTSSTQAIVQTTSTPPTLLLSVAVPNADRDRLFQLNLETRRLDEMAAQPGWRETALTQKPLQLTIGKNQDDVVVLSGQDWNVPLRTRGGTAYQDATFLGMFDATHAAVLGRASDRMLLSVSRVGEIRELVPLADNQTILLTSEGKVWVSTFVPGEGIESPPQGPSHLLRVDGSGITATMATEPQVIDLVVPGPGDAFAYATEAGEMVARGEAGFWKGQGRPLMWLDDGRVVIAQGRGVGVLTVQTGTIETVASLPVVPSHAVLSATETP